MKRSKSAFFQLNVALGFMPDENRKTRRDNVGDESRRYVLLTECSVGLGEV